MAWDSKDPNDVLDYQIDWTDWLDGDTIATSSWPLISGTVTLGADGSTDTTTTVWVSGGASVSRQVLENTITTAGGRTKVDRVELVVKEAK